MTLEEKLGTVRNRIASACERAGRNAEDVRLVVVTKMVGADVVRELLSLGATDIGENRVQDAARKMEELRGRMEAGAARFHMIGHLQRNKARLAVRIFDVIHSIDSLRLAEAVSRAAVAEGKQMPVLTEVNVGGEESKFGFDPAAARRAAPVIAALPGLRLEGLMAMTPFGVEEAALRCIFRSLRELAVEISAESNLPMPHLSMGMSQDYEIAVEEGATMVRVGTAIVG